MCGTEDVFLMKSSIDDKIATGLIYVLQAIILVALVVTWGILPLIVLSVAFDTQSWLLVGVVVVWELIAVFVLGYLEG